MRYKIEIADLPISTFLEHLSEILTELEKEHGVLLDFDITQNFAGVFNKQEVI